MNININIKEVITEHSSPLSKKILFVHHSTGRRLIKQGDVRQLVSTYDKNSGGPFEFWECDYNRIGLVDSKGKILGFNFEIPEDNTNPDGLEKLFTQPVDEALTNAFSRILLFDIIVFKSCFPVSAITSEEQLQDYKGNYNRIREVIRQHPSKFFVAMTPPPLIPLNIPVFAPAWTNPTDADRARRFANWMKSKEFIGNQAMRNNLAVFDFFDLLAGGENSTHSRNMLRPEYRGVLGLDSHPNRLANQAVAPHFVKFIVESYLNFLNPK